MPPSFVTIDTTVDLDMAPSAEATQSRSIGNTKTKRTLLLAPPSISAQEEKLRDLFNVFDRSVTDLQMLDRLAAGYVPLPADAYDSVLILTDSDGTRRSEALNLLTRTVFATLVPAMKVGATFKAQDGALSAAEAREALLSGLVEKDGGFEKANDEEEAVAVPLRFGNKKNTEGGNSVVKPISVGAPVTLDLDDDDDDDELIDENALLADEDISNLDIPKQCRPKPGRRPRACKDCTCGLAARLQEEDAAKRAEADKQLNVLKLESDDLNEVDFTIQGKAGSCNSCSLGDAFRCDGCPYRGLPAFKPGEEVRLLNDVAQV